MEESCVVLLGIIYRYSWWSKEKWLKSGERMNNDPKEKKKEMVNLIWFGCRRRWLQKCT